MGRASQVGTSGGSGAAEDEPIGDEEFYETIMEEERAIASKRRIAPVSDTEPDSDAEPEGAGPQGQGPPLSVGSFEKKRTLCDGAGLCSLGRWPPSARPSTSDRRLLELRGLVNRAVDELPTQVGRTPEEFFDELAAGRIADNPFARAYTENLAEEARRLFEGSPCDGRPKPGDRAIALHLRLLEAILRAGGDPDWGGMAQYAAGVRLGIGERLPRTPAVFARKVKWRLKGQELADELEGHPVQGVWRDNYRSVTAHQHLVEQQLADHHARGLALRLSPAEARDRFPELTVASMGAVSKVADPKHFSEVRLVVDGSNGVDLNPRVKQRDQDRCPTAADVKRYQRAQASEPHLPLGLALDVHEAHRIPPTREADWRHQGVRSSAESDIYIYMYNMFGYASSAYWWARLGGAVARAIHLVACPSQRLWVLLMADDFKIESSSRSRRRDVVWVVLLLVTMGVPLAWRKTQGGSLITWIGYSVNLAELSLGIAENRALWMAGWLERCARDGACCMGEFGSALGRLTFVAGALEFDRPFLGPLHSFQAASPRVGVRVLPTFVRVVALFLAERLRRRRHYPSAQRRSSVEPFRVDARAEGDAIGVGGWQPARREDGSVDKWNSHWFSLQLDRSSAPWAFDRGEAYRSIASLEGLAALLATIVFSPPTPAASDCLLLTSGFTDNRGNRYVLSRLQTQRYPLNVITMELAAQLEHRGMRLALEWAPREINTEADGLAAGQWNGFNPQQRIDLRLDELPWMLLPRFLALGREFEAHCKNLHAELRDRKARPRRPAARGAAGSFREREPW